MYYDPMLAKVIAHAPTREQAARLLARALAQARVHGVVTNRDLLVGIFREPEFLDGQIDTGYLTRHQPADLMAADPRRDEVHAIAVALADQAARRSAAPVLAAVPSGWRNVPNGPQQVTYHAGEQPLAIAYRVLAGLVVGGNKNGPMLGVVGGKQKRAEVSVNGGPPLPVLLHACTPGLVDFELDGLRRVVRVDRVDDIRYADSALGASVLTEQPRFPRHEAHVAPGLARRPDARHGRPGRVRRRRSGRRGTGARRPGGDEDGALGPRPARRDGRADPGVRGPGGRPGRRARRARREPGAAMSDATLYEVTDGIAWLTINRPQARNALGKAVRDGLWEGVRAFNADDSARVLVLTGAGDKAFCAGGDLKEMADTAMKVPPPDLVPQFGRNIDVQKPTIAAVNGVAAAGGFMLAQQCDLVVAAESARFGITEVKVGRGAPWAAPLPWLIPPRVAMEILLTGDLIPAARAERLGLVNLVVPDASLRQATGELARRIAANAPLSVLAGKKTVALIAEHPLSAAYDAADRIWEPVYLSEDAQEGPAAFRDKRPPQWKGR